ncbi:MAG: PAS domain S-box protein [Patescibacteria group bacterium]|jgi:PAS domain S-box-containing protein
MLIRKQNHQITAAEIKASEKRSRILLEGSLDAVMVLEPPNWSFASGNPATIRMFGVKDEKQFISLGPGDLSPKYQPDGQLSTEKAKKMIEKAFEEGSNYFEWVHKKYKGNEFPAVVSLTKMILDGRDILQATVRDITEQKKAEQALKEKINDLERLNKLMVGRELKMVELKERIKQLEAGKSVVASKSSWAQKFQEAVDLEESVIKSLGSNYLGQIEDFNLGILRKRKIKKLLRLLINDSTKHEDKLKELISYENGKRR